jgi:hypothetical protein
VEQELETQRGLRRALLSLVRPSRPATDDPAAERPSVVLPETGWAANLLPDPAVQAREAAVEQARALLLEARERGDSTQDLLALARLLHEARLELAGAIASAGGLVPQDLRDELALRERHHDASAPTTAQG